MWAKRLPLSYYELVLFFTLSESDKIRSSYFLDISSESRQASIYSNQTEQLYNTLGYSAVGNITGALVLSIVMAPKSDPQVVWGWFIAILSVSFYRSIFAFIYNRRDTSDKSNINWRFQFKLGANMLAITWSSSMWLFYPVGYAEYQVVLILALFARTLAQPQLCTMPLPNGNR